MTPELSPSLYAARTAAAIAREAANREIAAEQAIEVAATARLRHTRARRAAEAAERDISGGGGDFEKVCAYGRGGLRPGPR